MDRASRVDRTALVVDDDAFVLSAMAELLSEEGYDVHTASNGFSAVRLAMECQPLVVLLDLALPERSGNEVMAELRGDPSSREVAIVIVTGNPQSLTAAELTEIDGLVCKPFDTDELLATVQRALVRASTRRAEVAPVSAPSHAAQPAGQRRVSGARHTRGRR